MATNKRRFEKWQFCENVTFAACVEAPKVSQKVSISALLSVCKRDDALVKRLDVAFLDVGIDVLCHLYGCVTHKVLRDLGRDACLFEPRRIGVAQDMRRNVKAKLGSNRAKIVRDGALPACEQPVAGLGEQLGFQLARNRHGAVPGGCLWCVLDNVLLIDAHKVL